MSDWGSATDASGQRISLLHSNPPTYPTHPLTSTSTTNSGHNSTFDPNSGSNSTSQSSSTSHNGSQSGDLPRLNKLPTLSSFNVPYPGISRHQPLGRQQWERDQRERDQRERLEALDTRVPYYAASVTQSPQSPMAGFHSANVSQNGYSPLVMSRGLERGGWESDANIDPSLFSGGTSDRGKDRPTYSRPPSFSIPMPTRYPSYTGLGGNEGSTYGSQSDRGNSASLYHGNSGSPPMMSDYASSQANGNDHSFSGGSGTSYKYARNSAFPLKKTDSYDSALSVNSTGGSVDSEDPFTTREDELHTDPYSRRYSYRVESNHGHLSRSAPSKLRSSLGKRSYDDSHVAERNGGEWHTYFPPPDTGTGRTEREYKPRGCPPLPSAQQFSAVSYGAQPLSLKRGMSLRSHPIPPLSASQSARVTSPSRAVRAISQTSHASPGPPSRDGTLASPNKRHPCRFAPPHPAGCTRMFTTSGHASRHAKIHLEEKGIECVFLCGFCRYCVATRYPKNAGKVRMGNGDKKERKGRKGDGRDDNKGPLAGENEDVISDSEELEEGVCENKCTKRFTRADNMKQHLETHFRGRGRARCPKPTSTNLPLPATADSATPDEAQREKDKAEMERLLRWGVERRERERARKVRNGGRMGGYAGGGSVSVSPRTLKAASRSRVSSFAKSGDQKQYGATAMDALAYAALGES